MKAIWSVFGLALMVALISCDDGSSSIDNGLSEANWVSAFPAESEGAFLSVWGTSAQDIWTVGGPDMERSRVWHFDGEMWHPGDVDDGPLLNWVHGAGDVLWMVGNAGRIERRIGSKRFEGIESGTDQNLWGVWAASPEEAFAVGGDPLTTGDPDPVILHFKNGQWSRIAIPETEQSFKALFKVWGTDAQNVYAVGANGVILHFDGSVWRQQASGTARDFISLWGSGPTDIMAVGGRANGLIARFDGKKWTHKVLTGEPGMNGIWMNSQGQATVVGGRGRILVFGKKSMRYVRQKADNRLLLHGVWGSESGERFAVGGTLDRSPPWTGVVLEDVTAP